MFTFMYAWLVDQAYFSFAWEFGICGAFDVVWIVVFLVFKGFYMEQ